MVINMKGFSKIVIFKVLELSQINVEINLKELFRIVTYMEREFFIIKMETDILSNTIKAKNKKWEFI